MCSTGTVIYITKVKPVTSKRFEVFDFSLAAGTCKY